MVAATFGKTQEYRYCVNFEEWDDEKESYVLTCELLLFAFRNQNELFLKHAFRDAPEGPALYTSSIFHDN